MIHETSKINTILTQTTFAQWGHMLVAQLLGLTKPHIIRIDFFLSFFKYTQIGCTIHIAIFK